MRSSLTSLTDPAPLRRVSRVGSRESATNAVPQINSPKLNAGEHSSQPAGDSQQELRQTGTSEIPNVVARGVLERGVLEREAFAAALHEQPKLRQALIARYGSDIGEQAVAAAMAWAWEHQDRLVGVTALRAYLYRVGQSSMRRSWVWAWRNSATFPAEVVDNSGSPIDEALDLADLLRKLPQKQRTCVLLIHAHGWPYRDVAELLEISVDAVNNHTHRGMTTLRKLTKNAALKDQA